MNALTLTWGNDHSLVLTQGNVLRATLMVAKNGGRQDIRIHLPPEVTLRIVEDAWIAQKKVWQEIFLFEGRPPYIATRVIWLPMGSIMWHVLHFADKPHDLCGFTPLTEGAWRSCSPGLITLVRAT